VRVSRKHESPGAALIRSWNRTRRLPFGNRIFSWFVGRMAPYTGSMGATVLDLEPGHARVALRDRRAVRNHLASVHAVALANLGEMATGLALTTALAPGVRGIPVRITISYHKKARGTITADCRCASVPVLTEPADRVAAAQLRDRDDDVVAEVEAVWRLGPA
jgi:acyl-coenzyme A thioesterase PaaI-like protein